MTTRILASTSARILSRPSSFLRAQSTRAMAVPTLLSVSELKKQLGGPVVLDGSWHMPAEKRDPIQEFKNEHLPGARYFDIESIKDKTSSFPHMMPTATQFAQQVGELGITNSDHVVVYDTAGFFSAPRVYWMFKAFGHEKVSVLDGGLKAWKAAGYPVESGDAKVQAKEYKVPKLDADIIRYHDQILQLVRNKDSKTTIIDARSADRFNGKAPEPRAGLSSGHMPGAKNVSFKQLFDAKTGELHDNAQLTSVFEKAGVDVTKLKDEPVVLSCGSGVTASVLYFALERLGLQKLAVYDGSWTEYASLSEGPIVKD
ncbi:hypothetical protein BGX29_003948 [Mortierella sp. GBA35]|nr:hypothetical protein BGX29_003948 [Mortierella sp. GBA35]